MDLAKLYQKNKLIDLPLNPHGLSNDIHETERWIKECLNINKMIKILRQAFMACNYILETKKSLIS